MYVLCIQTQKQMLTPCCSIPCALAHTHTELTHADIHTCTKRGTHPVSRGERVCALHVRCSQRPSCRQTTQHNATQWLICPMKNEQAGLQSAHCAPLNVSTSSHSLSVCPLLTMWPFLSLFYYIPFFFFSSFCIPFDSFYSCHFPLSLPPKLVLSPWRHLALSIALSVADISTYD